MRLLITSLFLSALAWAKPGTQAQVHDTALHRANNSGRHLAIIGGDKDIPIVHAATKAKSQKSSKKGKITVCRCPSPLVSPGACTTQQVPFLAEGDTEGVCTKLNIYDANGSGAVDMDDIVFVSRSLADPLGEFPTGNLEVDINGDGVLDLEDLREMINYAVTVLDAEDLDIEPIALTSTIIETALSFFPPVQPDDISPSGNRRLQDETIPKDDTTIVTFEVPSWVETAQIQQPQCGLGTVGRYGKGSKAQDPARNWVNEYPYDPSLPFQPGDYIWYTVYFYGIPAFFLAQGWTEAAAAWYNYIGIPGGPRVTDYEKAYQEDSVIKAGVDEEITKVVQAVREMHDGNELSFEFYSTSAKGQRSDAGGEYQAVLGGHLIWSSGTVSYDPSACSLTVDILVKAEDFYDFNTWDGSTADIFVNLIPGSLSARGFAWGYITTGELSRTETIELECCIDDDCGDVTEFDCECNKCVTQCPTNQASGGQGFTSFSVDLTKTSGTITVFYEMYSVPDELTIYYEGGVIFSTGGLVSGSATNSVSFGSATSTSTVITVEINAPISGTAWVVSVSCPP